MEREVKGIFIPIEIWKAKDLSWTEKVVLMEIDSFTSRGADCFFSNKYIAEMMDIKEDTASKIVNSLIRKGYVRQTRFDGRNRYLESCIKILCRDEHKTEAESEKNPMRNRRKVQDNKIINKPTNNTNNIAPKFDFRKALIEIGVTEQVTDAWLEVRRQKKAVNSEIAFNSILSEIKKTRRSADVCIRTAVVNSWRGFKAAWMDKSDDDFPRPAIPARTLSTLSPIYK